MSETRFSSTQSYIADPSLVAAVNAALVLERPLLVKGEPGTGKTLLAMAISESLGRPLHRWHVKSTSKATEGLYTYDVVQRLNDSRFGGGDVTDIGSYIRMGALGSAFSSADPSVVLIDEIDKAEIEFPNDLLRELDEMAFHIHETEETVKATRRPFVLLTSNAERELPDAFLRRCVFHYLEFPTPDRMEKIVRVHHPNLDEELVQAALVRFYQLREQRLRKKPSTSELIDWLGVLAHVGVPASKLADALPFAGVLLKNEKDLGVV